MELSYAYILISLIVIILWDIQKWAWRRIVNNTSYPYRWDCPEEDCGFSVQSSSCYVLFKIRRKHWSWHINI